MGALFTSCREGKFSETHIQDPEKLCTKTRLAPVLMVWAGPRPAQHLGVLDKYPEISLPTLALVLYAGGMVKAVYLAWTQAWTNRCP